MKKAMLVWALAMSACGGTTADVDAPKDSVSVTAEDFSGAYAGERFIEYHEDSGMRTNRGDHDFVAEVSRELDEVVVLHRVSVCDIWLDLQSPVIPPQSCKAPSWRDGDGVPHTPRVSVTGSWSLVGDDLTVSLQETHVINTPGEAPTMGLARTTFSGIARAD